MECVFEVMLRTNGCEGRRSVGTSAVLQQDGW